MDDPVEAWRKLNDAYPKSEWKLLPGMDEKLRALAAHVRREALREAAGICENVGSFIKSVDHSAYHDPAGAKMVHALYDTGCHQCAEAILRAAGEVK